MNARKKGWHPDPFGIHAERFYYADGRPGRLVRDGARTESYDNPPAEGRDDLPDDESALLEPREPPDEALATGSAADGAPFASTPLTPSGAGTQPATSEPPIDRTDALAPSRLSTDDDTRPVAPTPAVPRVQDAAAVAPDPGGEPSPGIGKRLNRVGRGARRYAAVGGVLVMVLIVVLAFVLFLPSSPNGKTATGQTRTTSEGLSVAPSTTAGPTSTTVPPTAWSISGTYPSSTISLNALACSSSTSCDAVGETTLKTALLLSTTDGGAAWTQRPLPSGVGPLASVTCPSLMMCMAVGGNAVITTTDGGSNWQVQLLGTQSLTAVTCLSSTSCMAVGGETLAGHPECSSSASYATQNGGVSWSTDPIPCVDALGVACTSATSCTLVGVGNQKGQRNGEILQTSTAGAMWRVAYRADRKNSAIVAVTCPAEQVCEAVGRAGSASIVRTDDAGHAWVPQRVPDAGAATAYSAVSCQAPSVCVATGTSPPLSTGDGGVTWVRQSAPAVAGAITGVSCSSETTCTGVGLQSSGPGGITLNFMQ